MTQLEIGTTPEAIRCAWCDAPCNGRFQGSDCCAKCAGGTAKQRTTVWLQRVGRAAKR